MKTLRAFISALCLLILGSSISVYAVEGSSKITDREIIESLVRLEEGAKANGDAIKANREMIGFLRADIGSLRTELVGFLKWGFGLLFTGMLILVGFILWDRRSTLKLVKDAMDEMETRKVDRLIEAMKKLSEEDSRVAHVLRSVGLLQAVLEIGWPRNREIREIRAKEISSEAEKGIHPILLHCERFPLRDHNPVGNIPQKKMDHRFCVFKTIQRGKPDRSNDKRPNKRNIQNPLTFHL